MGCVDSCLFTWIYQWWLWLWRLPWLYCNGFFCWIIHGDGCFWRLGFFFPSMRVSKGISCATFFVGMLSILLHVDFNCIYISDLLWVMQKWLYSLLQVSLHKWKKAMKCFKEIMNSSSCSNGSRHSCTKTVESSTNEEMKNTKPKDKTTCYHYGKIGHTTNTCQSKHGMQNSKPKFIGYYFHYKKQGHQIYVCGSRLWNAPTTPRFEGYYYNYQKYGHRWCRRILGWHVIVRPHSKYHNIDDIISLWYF